MSLLCYLVAAATLLAIYIAKYEVCRISLSRRPRFKEVRTFKFEEHAHRRNARAVKSFAIFMAIFGFMGSFNEPGFFELISDAEVMRDCSLVLLMVLHPINYYARHVLYDEESSKKEKFDIPMQEMIHVSRNTGWLMKGTDLMSWVVNVTTIVGTLILINLIYSYIG